MHSESAGETAMPERETMKRARRDRREGKAASTQAGEFVREEIHHIREKRRAFHQAGNRNRRSKARRRVKLKPPRGCGCARRPRTSGRASASRPGGAGALAPVKALRWSRTAAQSLAGARARK